MIGVTSADRQAVFAGQHQVEHDQVHGLAREQAVQRLCVLGQQHFEAFLREVAAQQVADAGIVVDDNDSIGARVGDSRHSELQTCNRRDSERVFAPVLLPLTSCYTCVRQLFSPLRLAWTV